MAKPRTFAEIDAWMHTPAGLKWGMYACGTDAAETVEYLLERYSPEQLDAVFPKDAPKIGDALYVRRPRA